MKTKRVICMLLILTMVSCLVACGNTAPTVDDDVVVSTEELSGEGTAIEVTTEDTEIKDESETAPEKPVATASPEPTEAPVLTQSPEPTEPPHTHQYTEMITRQPTCAEAGEKTLTCSCGSTQTETIPASGEHNWVEQTQIVHHDEVGSIKTVQVGTNKRTVYYCLYCRVELGLGDDAFSSDNQTDVRDHCYEEGMAILDAGGTLEEAREHALCRGFCIDYYDPVYEEQYIVKSPAYDETVVTGYICSVCGAVR